MLNAEQMETIFGIRLHRMNGEKLLSCEAVYCERGGRAVDTVLRRAAISGRVEVEGKLENHFADLLDNDGSIVCSVALDARSYHAIKSRWAKSKLVSE